MALDALEKSRIKFVVSEQSGELIGFVSRHAKTKNLKGVREGSRFKKKICVLSEDLKGGILPEKLYDVELKKMHNGQGYVVVSAELALFAPEVKTVIIPKTVYQVCITFGNKTIYFDPKDGRSRHSKTYSGVLKVIQGRTDIKNKEALIEQFHTAAMDLISVMERDGYFLNFQG